MAFATLKNDRLLRALRREPTDTTPIWVMRQAGRYLPEYRTTRERAGSFMALAQNPELACEVTLQPLERFDLDAAILFSDILTIPEAMGLGLSFAPGEGPQFARPVRTRADVAKLAVPDMDGDLRYVMDAVHLIRQELHGRVPLIGFSGSPWTLACYMVEGHGSRDFVTLKAMCWNEPALAHQLLDILAQSVAHYLIAQVAAGAQVLMIFDTWGGMLSPAAFREFSLRYIAQIIAALKAAPQARLDHGSVRCTRCRRRQSRAARQPRSRCHAHQSRRHPPRSPRRHGQLWQLPRPYFQSRPRHHPGSESRAHESAGG